MEAKKWGRERVASRRGTTAKFCSSTVTPSRTISKHERLLRPADAAQEFVERGGRAFAVELEPVQAAGEVEQVAVDLPASRAVLGPGHWRRSTSFPGARTPRLA